MENPHKPRRFGPPYNPEVRDLVDGKHQWSSRSTTENLKQGFRGWHERGYLPHRDEPGLTQFVTFNLADAFPKPLREEWRELFTIEDINRRQSNLEDYLDKGRGSCWLGQPDIAKMVEEAIIYYHSQRYELKAWVIMPNHIHVLCKIDSVPLSNVIAELKRYTAREMNKKLYRKGQVWAEDYWDTFMRDSDHELRTRVYIENNPTKAFLVRAPKAWSWSSARFRDEYGVLRLP